MATERDYTILYRRELSLTSLRQQKWDRLVSTYDDTDRVRRVFGSVRAREKHWLIQPEYLIAPEEYPESGTLYAPGVCDVTEFVEGYLALHPLDGSASLCIDITGMMRPHLLYLVKKAFDSGVRRFDALYAEPGSYLRHEETIFAAGPVTDVRQVSGYEGSHAPTAPSLDLLVIGTGYDEELIRFVAEHKATARKIQMFGLPSLQADMYQENVLRSALVADSVGLLDDRARCFAPAYDPFATAQVLHDVVAASERRGALGNLYLAPLGTKPQVLGFGLYYLSEWVGRAASVLSPVVERYERGTAKGWGRIWLYEVELLV